jgi:O-antigen ligase
MASAHTTYQKRDVLFTLGFGLFLSLTIYLEWYLALVGLAVLGGGFLAASSIQFRFENHHLIYLLLFATFLLPILEVFSSIPKIRPEHLLFFSILPLYLVFQKRDSTPALRRFITVFFLFQAIQVLSMIAGYAMRGVPVNFKDGFEIIRVFQYGLAVLIIGNFTLNAQRLYRILYLILGLYLVATLIGLFQFYGILGFDWLTAPLYSESRINSVHIRVMGTFVNPNTFGSFLAVGALLAIGLVFYERKAGLKISLILLALLLVFTLSLTKSRTALLSFAAGFGALLLLFSGNRQRSLLYILIGIFGLALGALLLYYLAPHDVISRFATLTDITNDLSWQMRLYAWYVNLSLFWQAPLIGWGPAFAIHTPIVDSEYVLILRRYGIIGFLLYSGIYLLPIKTAWQYLKDQDLTALFSKVLLASMVVFLVTNITNPLFHEMQFMNFWCVWLGMFYALTNTLKS